MASQPLEKCYVEESMQSRLSPFAILVIIIYGIGFPGGIFVAFYLLRDRIKKDQMLRVHGSGDSFVKNKDLTHYEKHAVKCIECISQDFICGQRSS